MKLYFYLKLILIEVMSSWYVTLSQVSGEADTGDFIFHWKELKVGS